MNKRFLIVEDNPQLLRTVRLVFSSAFGQDAADTANCAQDALSMLKREHYELVVTDLGLPGMSGVELYRAALDFCANTNALIPPFIFCSGVREALNKAKREFEGPRTRFLEKPFATSRLLQETELLINDSKTPGILAI